MRLIFVTLLLIISLGVFAKGDVNYEHKSVIKTLVKTGKMVNPSLLEMNLPASISSKHSLQGKFFSVNNENSQSQIKNIYIGRVNSCRAGGCSIPNAEMGANSEYFDYFICFDQNCEVLLVKVFNYQATHGHEVTAKGWLKQFIGHQPEQNLKVGKDIDSISGATISVKGITQDVNDKTQLLKQILNN